MCSRFTLTSKPVLVGSHFGLAEIDDFPPRYNIAPTQPVGIVRTGYHRQREFALVRWGLLPDWVKDPGAFTTLVNARAETLTQKPSFRSAFKYRRCLFPMNGFYEWSGGKGERQPHYISTRGEAVFAVAGLWENWMGVDGSEMESAVIITTRANSTLSAIHQRMPVVIEAQHFESWLNCTSGKTDEVVDLLRPADNSFFKLQQVSILVNNPQNSGSELLRPVGQQELF
ncbi:MAG: SOS response-associated peptidase [Hyphomicrobiaceae bacterium]|nr:SOS response-associated peptidase [Hyphomicrobiaceae bacterium]